MECRVGLPTDGVTRWRCEICSLLNVYSNNECQRCKEPMSEDRKQQNKLLPQKKRSDPKVTVSSTSSNSRFAASSTRPTRNANKSMTATQPRQHARNAKKPNNNNTFGFDHKKNGSKMKQTSVGNNKDYKMKKLKKEDFSERHLGYKASKKRNVNTFVRSRLNQDTASYRAKGSKNPNDKKSVIQGMKKGVQYATINDLTRNGFQTTLSTNKSKRDGSNAASKNKTNSRFKQMSEDTKASIRKLNDERPVTPPPRGMKGKGGKRSLIDHLQKAHSGEIMANLRQGGRYMRPGKKQMAGGTTVYEL